MNLKFFPDYSKYDKYQKILYSESQKNNFIVNPLINPFNISNDTEIVHFHWIHAIWKIINVEPKDFVNQGFPGLFDYKNKGIKTVWTIHNTLPHETNDFKSEIALMQKFSDESDVIHIMLKEGLEEIEKYIKIDHNKVFFRQNASYNNVLKNNNFEKNNKIKLGISENSTVIGCIGQIRPYKNIEMLLNAYLNLREKHENIYLLVAGLNKDKVSVEKIIKESYFDKNIILIDRFIDDKEFSEISNAIDIAAYTYKDILNSGSAYTSFTFGHHVILPKLNTLKSLSNLIFVSFFEPESLNSLIKVLDNAIKSKKYLNLKKECVEWNLKNNSSFLSNDFFNEIRMRLS